MFFGTMKIAKRVVFQAIEDATDLDADIRQDALRWIGSQDFIEACSEAGLDSVQLKKFVAQIMKLPTGIRRKQVQSLLDRYI